MIRPLILFILARTSLSTCCATLKLSDASPTTAIADISVLHRAATESKDLAYRVQITFSPDYASTEQPKSVNAIDCAVIKGRNGWECSGNGAKTFTAQFVVNKPFSAIQNDTRKSELVASVSAYGEECGMQDKCEENVKSEESVGWWNELVDLGPFGVRSRTLVVSIGVALGVLVLIVLYAMWRRVNPKKKYRDESSGFEVPRPPKRHYDEEKEAKSPKLEIVRESRESREGKENKEVREKKEVKEDDLVKVPKPLARNASREFHEVRRSTSKKSSEHVRNRSFDAPVDEMPAVPDHLAMNKEPRENKEVKRLKSAKHQRSQSSLRRTNSSKRTGGGSVKRSVSNKSSKNRKKAADDPVRRSASNKSRRTKAPQEDMPVERSASSKSHKKKEGVISVKVKTTGVGPRVRKVAVDNVSVPEPAKTARK